MTGSSPLTLFPVAFSEEEKKYFQLSQSAGAYHKQYGKGPRRFHFFLLWLQNKVVFAQSRVEMEFCSYQRSTCVGRIKGKDKKLAVWGMYIIYFRWIWAVVVRVELCNLNI